MTVQFATKTKNTRQAHHTPVSILVPREVSICVYNLLSVNSCVNLSNSVISWPLLVAACENESSNHRSVFKIGYIWWLTVVPNGTEWYDDLLILSYRKCKFDQVDILLNPLMNGRFCENLETIRMCVIIWRPRLRSCGP